MSKIITALSVPVLNEKYDIFLQDNITIEQLIPVIIQGIFDISSGKYTSSGNEMLMSLNPERLLNPKKTLSDYGIMDGESLMII